MKKVYFFERIETPIHPAGITVTKKPDLPKGNFRITEYCWGSVALWFVDDDNFNSDERQAAYIAARMRTTEKRNAK